MNHQKGLMWAIGTALVSGISVYVNKFGVAQVSDPYVYTTLKNTIVAVILLVVLGALMKGRELRAFSMRQWAGWFALGLIGGGIPFLLFFQGLATASASNAALIHKSLFIWVALLALPLLGEELGLWQVLGLLVIAGGEYLIQIPTRFDWGGGETLILTAVVLWALETIVAKRVLKDMSAPAAALGRMGVGALVMWGFLGFTGRTGAVANLTATGWSWIAITALFLVAYVWTWYRALQAATATLVTVVLTLGLMVTLFLTDILDHRPVAPLEFMGSLFIIVAVGAWVLPRVGRVIRAAEA